MQRGTNGRRTAASIDDYLMWKNEGCDTVFKLNQVHDAIEVTHLAKDSWTFAKTGMSLAIADWLKQSAISPHNPILPVFCR